MLICMIYVLGGIDCFYDQFIAHGEQPMLVDASHLLQPVARASAQAREGEDWEQTVYSVLHIEAPAGDAFPLKTFLDIWGRPISSAQLPQRVCRFHRMASLYQWETLCG